MLVSYCKQPVKVYLNLNFAQLYIRLWHYTMIYIFPNYIPNTAKHYNSVISIVTWLMNCKVKKARDLFWGFNFYLKRKFFLLARLWKGFAEVVLVRLK